MATAAKALDPTQRGFATKELEQRLQSWVIGQNDAVECVVNAMQAEMVGLNATGKPLASFLFLGPTGTGKTHVVESLAETLYGNPHAMLKIDCAEFAHGHEIAKIIGSPPGYLGHRETKPVLAQANVDQYFTAHTRISLILFDEIEKASDTLWNLLLGILDKATLTMGDNATTDFSRAMVFMTSNLGAKEIQDTLAPRLGFAPVVAEPSVEKLGLAAARRRFTPEFINRIDRTVVFKSLGAEELNRILDLELGRVRQRIALAGIAQPRTPQFLLEVTSATREFLLREGTDARYGARHLKRSIERNIVQPVANLLASNQIPNGATLTVRKAGEGLSFTC